MAKRSRLNRKNSKADRDGSRFIPREPNSPSKPKSLGSHRFDPDGTKGMTSNKGRSGKQAPSTKTGNSIGLLTLSLLSGLTVYLAYHPSDSISVERGDAVWFCMLALGLFAMATMCRVVPRRQTQGTDLQLTDSDSSTPFKGVAEEPTSERPQNQSLHHFLSGKHFSLERGLLCSPWCIAIWMMIAAFAVRGLT